jgi:8-oxo-dGTP diphosphatase
MLTIVKIVLLNDESQVLLNLRDKDAEIDAGMWSFFGGKVDGDESPDAALVREIKEEISFDLKDYKVLYEVIDGDRKKIFYIGKCNLPLHSLTLGEGEDFAFFSFEETKNLPISELNRKVLAMAFK